MKATAFKDPVPPETEAAFQLIAFEIEAESYGVEITAVREIRAWTGATSLPSTPTFVRGVINLRGAIVPILDLRARFNRSVVEPTKTHVVVVIAIEERLVGLLVDAVSDIVTVDRAEIQPPPEFCGGDDAGLVIGLAPHKGGMLALLDINLLLRGALPA